MRLAEDAELSPLLRLGAGACAGIIAMSATYPMDMVRGRLTVQVSFWGWTIWPSTSKMNRITWSDMFASLLSLGTTFVDCNANAQASCNCFPDSGLPLSLQRDGTCFQDDYQRRGAKSSVQRMVAICNRSGMLSNLQSFWRTRLEIKLKYMCLNHSNLLMVVSL